jgi:glutamate transport system ATP-binding protein
MTEVSVAKEDVAATGELVVLKSVNKHFGALHVLQDIDLTIARGEVVVVIGPSGSGKSTLCRTINRLETIDSGDDHDRRQAAARRRARSWPGCGPTSGMVFQSFNLFAHKTVLENVMLGQIKVRKADKKQAEEKARRCSTGSAWPPRRTSTPPSSPAASSSASPSRGRWPWTPR